MGASKSEMQVFLERNGWNWGFIENPPLVVKRKTHFRYGSIELLCPRITMYRS
jgi:hypothetical protein